jgi:hypothetical protein
MLAAVLVICSTAVWGQGAQHGELSKPLPRLDKVIGIWISNRSNVTARIVVFEHLGKVWMEYGSPGLVSELVRTKRGQQIVLRDKEPHPSDVAANLYWIIDVDGSLEWHGSGKLQEKVPLLRK